MGRKRTLIQFILFNVCFVIFIASFIYVGYLELNRTVPMTGKSSNYSAGIEEEPMLEEPNDDINIIQYTTYKELYDSNADKGITWYIKDKSDAECNGCQPGAFSEKAYIYMQKDILENIDGALTWKTFKSNEGYIKSSVNGISSKVKYVIVPNDYSPFIIVIDEDGYVWTNEKPILLISKNDDGSMHFIEHSANIKYFEKFEFNHPILESEYEDDLDGKTHKVIDVGYTKKNDKISKIYYMLEDGSIIDSFGDEYTNDK